jgi:hypothetical protein
MDLESRVVTSDSSPSNPPEEENGFYEAARWSSKSPTIGSRTVGLYRL